MGVPEEHDGITRAIVEEGERETKKRCARAGGTRTTRARDDARDDVGR